MPPATQFWSNKAISATVWPLGRISQKFSTIIQIVIMTCYENTATSFFNEITLSWLNTWNKKNSQSYQLRTDYFVEDEWGPQWRAEKEHKYLYSEIFYGGHKLHKYFSSLRVRLRLCWPVRISANYVTIGNINVRQNLSSYLFEILKRIFC